MAVGPEAAGSLLLGTAITTLNQHHPAFDDGDEAFNNARLAGVITGMTGAFAFIAGIVRLGFLDSVLSRPLLRGFISAVGFVIFVDQLIVRTLYVTPHQRSTDTHPGRNRFDHTR